MDGMSFSELEKHFYKKYTKFYEDYLYNEEKRAGCLLTKRKLEAFLEYLERCKEYGIDSVDKIIPWKHVCPDDLKPSEYDTKRVKIEHEKKLDRYRKRKPWEAWCEEDENDMEGDRILAEIQNYKQEVKFNEENYD